MKNTILFFSFLLAAIGAGAQSYPGVALQNSSGNYARVVPSAPITICAITDTAVPCTVKAQTYADQTLASGAACTLSNNAIGAPTSGANCNNPGVADTNGNWVVFLLPGNYRMCIYAQNYNCAPFSVGNVGTTITLKTNGTLNGSQSVLNLAAAGGITLVDNGSGTITITATGGVGSLSIGAVGAAPSTLSISTEGTKDWLIPSPGNAGQAINLPFAWRWKATGSAGTSAEMALSFRLISVGSAVTYSSGTASGVPAITSAAGDEAADVNDNFTAPNGYPTTSRAPYRSLVSVNYPGNPFGWSFLAPSDGNSRTLNLYFDIGGNTSLDNSITATIFAHLLDGSAADVSSSVTLGGGTGSASYKVSITFKSGTGSHLLVTGLITAASGTNPGCELRFRAATVQ